jgi:flagellar protein FliO/FliZ
MNSVEMIGRLLISLAFVLGLMWLIARRVKRGGKRGRNGKLIELLSRQQLSRSASVAVVRVADQALIIGVTDGQVTVLGETDLEAAQASLGQGQPASPGPEAASPAPEAAAAPRTATARTTTPTATSTAPSRTAPVRTAKPVRMNTMPSQADNRGALAGSALSPATWRQTVDTLRDLTARRT